MVPHWVPPAANIMIYAQSPRHYRLPTRLTCAAPPCRQGLTYDASRNQECGMVCLTVLCKWRLMTCLLLAQPQYRCRLLQSRNTIVCKRHSQSSEPLPHYHRYGAECGRAIWKSSTLAMGVHFIKNRHSLVEEPRIQPTGAGEFRQHRVCVKCTREAAIARQRRLPSFLACVSMNSV